MHQWVEIGGQMPSFPWPELGQCEARVILCPEDSAPIVPRGQCPWKIVPKEDPAPFFFFGFPPSISWNQLLTPECLSLEEPKPGGQRRVQRPGDVPAIE